MPQRNGNTVAVERRVDLASLFCMIGRHGPAVALGVIAMLSVLGGFIIYRTVRGKRRKAAAADGGGQSPGAESDAAATRPSPAESTDMSDEGSSKEDVDLTQSDLKIRRRYAAEKKPPPYSPPKGDIQALDNKQTPSGDTEEMAVVWDSYKVARTYAEEANRNLQSDTSTVAEMVVEEAVDCHQGGTDDIFEDVIEAVHDNSCLKEPVPIKDEKVLKAVEKQVEMWPSTSEQETNLPATQLDQCSRVTDTVTLPIRRGGWDEDGGLAGEVIEVTDDHLNQLTAVRFDSHSPQFDKKEVGIEQEEENGLACNQEDSVLYDGADQVTEEKLTSDNVVAGRDECDGSSVAPSPGLPCLRAPIKVDNQDDGLSGITTDAKAQISGSEDFLDLSLGCQQLSTTEISHPHVPSCYKNQQSVKMENNEVFVKASPPQTSICQHQQSDLMENDESSDMTRVSSATDAAAYDNAIITTPTSEEISYPDMLSSSQDQQSDQTKDNYDFPEITDYMTDISPPMCQSHLLSFKQCELRDNDISSCGVGEESGISSMAVSPDLQDAGDGFDVTLENMVLPVTHCDLQSEGPTEAQNCLFDEDVAVSVINEGMVFGPYPSSHSQPPHSEHKDWTYHESFAANEDMFGHEIEDSYHRAMDQFTGKVTTMVPSFPIDDDDDDMKVVVEVIEINEKMAGVSIEKREETNAEKEKEEDYEKTEISIMEATMDNNEWVTDSNYQVLPWMNLSAPSSAQDYTKTNQLPTEECQYSSAVTDTTCIDATDIPPSINQTSTLSLVDENTEINKKVVAVQPMPQNVSVTFRIHYVTQSPYQTVAVTGNQQELGNWKGYIPLERAKDGHWAKVVGLPTESHVEWKFVLVDKGEVCRWEECGNRLLDTGYGEDLLVHKWWGLL